MTQFQGINRRFLALQALITAMSCVGVAFIVPILQGFGYDSLRIGMTMTLAACAAFVAKPIWGFVGDRFPYARQVVLCGAAAGCLCYLLLIRSGGSMLPVAVAVMGLDLTILCMMNFVDSWALRLMSEGYPLNYGLTRAGGSFSYAVTAAVFGVLIERFGSRAGIPLLIGMLLLLVLTVMGIPNPHVCGAAQVSLGAGARTLLTNRPYLVVLAAYFLCTLCSCATDSFFSPLITSLGGTQSLVGLGLFVQAMSEVPVMLVYGRIKRRTGRPAWQFLAAAMVFFGLKCVGMGLAPNYPTVLVMTLLHGLSFALLTPALVDFVLETVQTDYLSTAHLLCGAVGVSLGAMVGNTLDGAIASAVGVANMMVLVSVFSFAAASLVFFYFSRREKKD